MTPAASLPERDGSDVDVSSPLAELHPPTPAAQASIHGCDEEVEKLLSRLCDTEAEVVFFPVRHHSPAAAMLVAELIDRMKPAAVLIEGPSDFNDRISELQLEHELPIAIYSYFRSGEFRTGAYYPFSDYSPEWSALRHAARCDIVVRFIDLPWHEVAHHDRVTHRYADSELRRGRYVQALCERLHVESFDDLWDNLVESHDQLALADYLARVHAFCLHTRMWEEAISVADCKREAFMAAQIRRVRSELGGPLLVVTGGFHSSALAADLEGWKCFAGIDLGTTSNTDESTSSVGTRGCDSDAPVIDEKGIALTTYSYERLDSLTGYDSGMPSPGFYDHIWRQRQAGEPFSHIPLLTELVRELRERKQTLSTADLIAVETGARALASLRGRAHVWRRDLIDAVTSSLIKDELEYGCSSPFIDAVHAVLRGHRRGRLAEGTRMPPLVLDIRDQLSEARLLPARGVENVELDLLVPDDLAKSRLLHRLSVLRVAGFERTAGTDFLDREDLTRLWEAWRIRWSPEFESTCIEAARYGTSLVDAVAGRLSEAAGQHDRDASAAAALLVQAAQAGIDTISQPLLDRLSALIQSEAQFSGAATALGHLLFLYCHDEAFGTTRAPQVGRVLIEAFGRSLWLLEMIGHSTSGDRALLQGMKAILETCQRVDGASSVQLDRDECVAVMLRIEGDSRKPATVRGAAAGILWTLGVADETQVLSDLLQFAVPSDLGDFLSGLFALAREASQRHPQLVQVIDRMLIEFGADDFQASLPSLRLAFTYFTPREKHYMLTTLFESLGLKGVQPLAALSVDAATAAEALAFEERLFEMVSKYGLELSDD